VGGGHGTVIGRSPRRRWFVCPTRRLELRVCLLRGSIAQRVGAGKGNADINPVIPGLAGQRGPYDMVASAAAPDRADLSVAAGIEASGVDGKMNVIGLIWKPAGRLLTRNSSRRRQPRREIMAD
jgi:hypothetical protein